MWCLEDLKIKVLVVNLVAPERLCTRRNGQRHYCDKRQGNHADGHSPTLPEIPRDWYRPRSSPAVSIKNQELNGPIGEGNL